ncbi:MAG: Pr6Pr family membrane protein [Erysipelotrichaceae bacterium]|nr:Pr6Pr family membrane protein [Erysipelotrichaceae bacterium]
MEKGFCAAAIALGIYSLLKESGLPEGKYRKGFLGYYTILSNILVLLYFCGHLYDRGFISQLMRKDAVALSVTLSITVTFLVYHFLIHPVLVRGYREGTVSTPYTLANLSLHYIIPLMTIAHWLFFASKSDLSFTDGIRWLIIPQLYLAYLWSRKLLNISAPEFIHGYYPYDFLNVDDYGLRQVFINVIILMIAFGLLGIILVAAAGLLKGSLL